MKKIVLVAALIIIGGGIFASFSLRKTASRSPQTSLVSPTPTPPIEESIKERPFVSLTPSSDGHWLTLEIKNLTKEVSGLEYELVYLADVEGSRIERGVTTGGKPVELNGASEYTKKILLGSASCTTGVCKYKYDENVSEGTLMVKFSGNKSAEYQTVYRLQRGAEAKTDGFSAGDGYFRLTGNLPAKTLYLTMSTVGVPVSLPEGVTAKSIPYGVFPSISGKVEVAFKTNLSSANIYAYNGRGWQKLATTIKDGEALASVTDASIFILTE